ncbi:MAG: hypothetical protein EA393_05710 [Bacteroidetes bacterium]|nr:MAG: hypothetical protein EA393_05710 [Bacteroidota bacterium]
MFLLFILFLQNPLQSQTVLKGKVRDENQKPLSHINILVYPHGKQNLIAFGISRGDGSFEINLRTATDSLRLEATSVHYRNDSLFIANTSQEVLFSLVPETKDLSEFVVRASPIVQRGDTISYLVSSFARVQDRVIADVLKQMPGIEVEPSGRILYQGDPIQHFYVEGLDLMGGRYGLVSGNMPHRSVATVQILENHQPIKILEDRLPSHRASLNITLKREVTTTGTARLGSGLTPLLWDANATPMMFTRNFQLAGSYQANNTGNDATRQLDALTMEGLRDRMENNLTRPSVLGIPLLSPPGFNENRYLDNNLHLLNANALVRLPGELQLRSNLHYINDLRQQQGNTRRTLYTPSDTLVFDEQIHNELRDNALRGEFTLTRNTKNNYLNNKLEFQTYHNQQSGNFTTDTTASVQNLRNPFHTLSNRLNMVKPIGEKLVQLNSHLYYDRSPHQLAIAPGRFEEVFSAGEAYDKIIQQSNLQRFSATHSASLSLGWRRWSITPRLGFQFQQQHHSSNIVTQTDQSSSEPGENFINSLDGLRTRTYLQTEWLYKRGERFTFTADIPVSHIYIQLQDKPLEREQQINRVLVDPRISADYRLGNFWRTRASWSYRNQLGEMDGIHYAWILTNHRNLHINDAPLQESQTQSFLAFLGYRNPIEAFFSSLTYMYHIRNNNLLYTNTINDDGTTLRGAIELQNTARTHNVHARASKYFSRIKSTLSAQGSLGLNIQDQWVNEEIFPGKNHTLTLAPKANIRLTEWMNTEWSAEWLYYDTYRDNVKLNTVNRMKYFGNLLFFPARNQHLAITGEYYQHENLNNYFVDLQYRYTITARRIDVDVRWVNIFNHKTYHDYHIGPYSLMENQYYLRPTQLVVLVRFSF